jgi:putative transcriptional regulator
MLAQEEPLDMAAGSLDAVFARIDAAPMEPVCAERSPSPLPHPVVDRLGVAFDSIPWKFQLPGVSAYDFDGFGDEKVQLLRAKPGAKVPQHTHEGPEMTLVMQGSLMDGGIVYNAGDVAVNDEDDDHRPEIIGDEVCYCLIVQQGDLKFTGRFSRLLNYLGE